MEDGLVAHLLAIVLVQVIVDFSGRLQSISEASEVIVLQTPSQLGLDIALQISTNWTFTLKDRSDQDPRQYIFQSFCLGPTMSKYQYKT